MTGAHTFSIVWHNDNGGAKVHMRQSRCAHGQRGNSLSSASLSLLIRKDSIMHDTLHNLGFKCVYEVLSNSIVLKPLCYADLGQQEAQFCQLFLGVFPLLHSNHSNNNAKQSFNVKSRIWDHCWNSIVYHKLHYTIKYYITKLRFTNKKTTFGTKCVNRDRLLFFFVWVK